MVSLLKSECLFTVMIGIVMEPDFLYYGGVLVGGGGGGGGAGGG